MSYVPLIVEHKIENCIAQEYKSSREREVIRQRKAQASQEDGLDLRLVEEVMRSIIKYSNKLEENIECD